MRGLWLAALCAIGVLGCGPRTMQTRANGFVRVQTRDVRLRTDLDEGRARELASRLQRMREYFSVGLFPCARGVELEPIHVTALHHPEDLVELTGHPVGGFFSAPRVSWLHPQLVIGVSDVDDTRAVAVFNHELAHRFVALCYPRAPRWLNEGIAELFETVRQVDERSVVLGYPPWAFGRSWGWTVATVPARRVPMELSPTFSALRAMSTAQFYGAGLPDEGRGPAMSAHYATAWAAVHMLQLGDPALRERFGRYLAAMRRSQAPEPMIWDELFGGIDLDRRLRAYQVAGDFRFNRDALPPSTAGEPRLARMTEADAHLLWAELYLREERSRTARAHLASAEPRGEATPRSLLLRGTLAERSQRPERSVELFERACALDPESVPLAHARAAAALRHAHGTPRYDAALAHLRPRATRAEDFALLGAAALADGQPDDALRLAGRALRMNRLCWRCLAVAGEAHLALGDPEHAAGPLRLALALLAHHDAEARRRVSALLGRAVSRPRAPAGELR